MLLAASRGEEVADAHLAAALAELMSARQHLTRRMLGAGSEHDETEPDETEPDTEHSASFGWFS